MAQETQPKVRRIWRARRLEETVGEELLKYARAAAAGAYAPYSGFHVGAALVTHSGDRFTGVNVENASYGLTLCAERAAVAAAVASQGPKMRVHCLAVAVLAERAFTPCGACRQVLAEFAKPEMLIFCAGPMDRRPIITTLGALLPSAFSMRAVQRSLRGSRHQIQPGE